MKTIGGYNSETRIEVAVLQNDVSTKTNSAGEFKIPSLMGGTDNTTVFSSSKNLKNKTNNRKSKVNIKETISLEIPYYFKIFFSEDVIPSGTKFLISLEYDNISDSRIIGLYDKELIEKFEWNYMKMEKKVKKLISAVQDLQSYHHIYWDWSD